MNQHSAFDQARYESDFKVLISRVPPLVEKAVFGYFIAILIILIIILSLTLIILKKKINYIGVNDEFKMEIE